jgi:hypothetical protein
MPATTMRVRAEPPYQHEVEGHLQLQAPQARPIVLLLHGGAAGTTEGVFDTPALEGLASEPGSGQPELGPEKSEGLFDVFVPTEPG